MKNIKILNGTAIKIIALFLMTLDHIYEMFYYVGAPVWLTVMGRVVFPMFLFIAADSFHYTHDRYRFLKRLLIGSLFVSAASFTIERTLPNQNVVIMNNAFSTFFVVGIYTFFIDNLKEWIKSRDKKKLFYSVIWFMIPVATAIPALFMNNIFDVIDSISNPVFKTAAMFVNYMIMTFPSVLSAEGGILLVAMGLLFYIFREKRLMQCLVLVLFSVLVYCLGDRIQSVMALAVIPMLMYNGKKGRGMKYLFYVYYPLHLYVLYVISTVFFAK